MEKARKIRPAKEAEVEWRDFFAYARPINALPVSHLAAQTTLLLQAHFAIVTSIELEKPAAVAPIVAVPGPVATTIGSHAL
jgi:hypothetical protein